MPASRIWTSDNPEFAIFLLKAQAQGRFCTVGHLAPPQSHCGSVQSHHQTVSSSFRRCECRLRMEHVHAMFGF
jgi:hypothetical protein